MKINATFSDFVKANAAKIADIKEQNKSFNKELQATSEEFEAVFLKHLLDEFVKGQQTDGLIEKSHAQTLYEDMLNNERAKNMAQSGGIGLGKFMFENLKRNE